MKKILFKILSILTIILCIGSFIFTKPIFTNDELWNFQHLFKLHNGYILYEDINAITTPIFYYLGYIVLSIFSFTMVGFRIYNLLIYIALILTITQIFKKLNVCTKLIPAYISLIILLLVPNILAGANYTLLSVLFFTIGMYLYIAKKSNNIIQGLLIYFCIFTKQNVGLFYTLTVLIYELINNKKLDIQYIKNQFIKFFVFLFPSLATLLYLYITGSFNGFLNYCIGGLFEFGNYNFLFIVPFNYIIIVFTSIIIYLLAIILKHRNIKVNDANFYDNINILFIFTLGILPVTYPIFNSTHFLYVVPFSLILLFYFLDALLFKELFDINKLNNIIFLFYLILLIITIRNFSELFINKNHYHFYNDTSTPYSFLYIDNELYLQNEQIKDFILKEEKLGKTVKILAYDAALPMIELKKSNGKYDLFFTGNLGYNGINTSIEEIAESKNTLYLIFVNEEKTFDQEPLKARNYITDNLNYKGKICNYSIYESN